MARLNSAEMAQRNAQIVEGRRRGLSNAQLAATYQITERQVERIFQQWRKSRPKLQDINEAGYIEEVLDAYRAAAEELALVAATTGDNHAARVAAIRERVRCLRYAQDLLQMTGIVRHDLGTLRVEVDLQVIAARVSEVFATYRGQIPPELEDRLLEAIEPSKEPVASIGQG